MLILRFKRILYFLVECLIFIFGILGAVIFAAALNFYFGFSPAFPFLFGLAATLAAFFYARSQTLPFKLEYEATRFLAQRRFANLHSRRARFFRFCRRVLVALPVAWALAVLFFFPQVTHIFHPRNRDWRYDGSLWTFFPPPADWRHPGADHLLHNQIRIPWGWTILNTYDSPERFSAVYTIIDNRAPWPFGGKYRPGSAAHLSGITLSSLNPEEVADRRQREAAFSWPQMEKAERISRAIHANGIDLGCSGYLPPWSEGNWVVHCETSSSLQERNLDAHFFGPAETLPAFYRLMETARPAN